MCLNVAYVNSKGEKCPVLQTPGHSCERGISGISPLGEPQVSEWLSGVSSQAVTAGWVMRSVAVCESVPIDSPAHC